MSPDGRLRESAVARELGISRTPVREAIRQLEREGVLVVRANCGASLNVPSPAEVDELYEFRELLEGHAAAKAADNATPKGVAMLRSSLEEMLDTARRVRAAGLTRLDGELDESWVGAEIGFHGQITNMAGNRWIGRASYSLQVMHRIVRFHRSRPSEDLVGRLARACLNHYRVLRAIEEGNAAAARRHMEEGIRRARVEARQAS